MYNMVNNELISVVIPVYNTESYLQKCVESVVNQTYRNLEILLVDDGSKEPAATLCDELAKTDVRIKVIHKPNGGISSARNTGLKCAEGQYIGFVDSDDFLAPNAYEYLYSCLKKCHSAISCMRLQHVDENYNLINVIHESMKTTSCSSEVFLREMCCKRKSESVCNKLFSIDLLKDTYFCEGRVNEDFLFLCKVMNNSFTVSEINYAGYYYYDRQGSISRSGLSRSLMDSIRNPFWLMQQDDTKRYDHYYATYAMLQLRAICLMMPYLDILLNTERFQETVSILRVCILKCMPGVLSKPNMIMLRWVSKLPHLMMLLTHSLFIIKNKIK